MTASTSASRRRLKVLLIRTRGPSSGQPQTPDTVSGLLAAGHIVTEAKNGGDAARILRSRPLNLILLEGSPEASQTVEIGASLRSQSGRISARYTPIFLLTPDERALESLPWYIDAALRAPLDADSLINVYLDFLSHRLTHAHRGAAMNHVCEPQAAIDRLGGDMELYQDLVERFLNDTAGGRERIKSAVQRRDPEEIHRASHSLKGLAASVGAVAAANALAELEGLGSRSELAHLADAWERFQLEMLRTNEELCAYRRHPRETAERM
jgi:HPt (histidine-containing phosphotransfer) domain-containing protein